MLGDMNFELKSSLINMVQASLSCGKPIVDANAHLPNFLELCDTIVIHLQQHYKSKGVADSFWHPKTLYVIRHPRSDC